MSFYTLKRRVKRLLSPPPGGGAQFTEQFRFLQSSQWWDYEEIQAYQNEQLRTLVCHCYDNVPYYHKLFDSLGLLPKDFQTAADLVKLPLLTKDTIRDNTEALLATNVPPQEREFHTTGGTSGTPLGVCLEKRTDALRTAFDWRFRGWAGFRFNDRHAFLRGRSITHLPPGKCWMVDPYHNCLLFSSFDMSESNMTLYLKKIHEFRPKFLLGFPASLELLAGFILDNGITVNESGDLLGLITSSETIYPHQKRKITLAFRAPVFDYYGNTEQAARFGECPARQGYHEYAEHGIVEIVAPDANGVGEIVGTSFINYAMPLLRYSTGDRARRSDKPCSCGRNLPLLDHVEGRIQDVAILGDGTRIPIVAFFFSVHVPEMEQIRRLQLVQDEPGSLTAMVVKGRNYVPNACESMFNRMNANLRVPFEMKLSFVEDIPRTREGKHRFFVQKIPSDAQIRSNNPGIVPAGILQTAE
jgi:phenylacetate-CoA ligase